MNWSGIDSKSVFGKILRLFLMLVPKKTIVPIMQGRLKGTKWIVGSSTHGCWLGSYEYEKQKLFEQKITHGSIVYDLGAHVGFYTLLASKLTGPSGKVISFEPIQSNLNYLKKHIQINDIKNVAIIEAAVSDMSGTVSFKEGHSSTTGHIAPATEEAIKLKTVSLDELISLGKIPPPDFIKIDIEGAEALALGGAKKMLGNIHPAIFLATHGKIVHEECCKLLKSLAYNIETIDGLPLDKSNEIYAELRSASEIYNTVH
jgi:FkbM family methyltransferase